MSTRPDKEIILNSASDLGLTFSGNITTLKPYHWGMQLIKTVEENKGSR